jgi:hypothetical protein
VKSQRPFSGKNNVGHLTNEALSVRYAEILWLRRAIKDITLSNKARRFVSPTTKLMQDRVHDRDHPTLNRSGVDGVVRCREPG